MGLKFDPSLEASGRQDKTAAASRTRGSAASRTSLGATQSTGAVRKSISDTKGARKAKARSSASERSANSPQSTEPSAAAKKKLSKLERETAKIERKNAKKQAKAEARAAKRSAGASRTSLAPADTTASGRATTSERADSTATSRRTDTTGASTRADSTGASRRADTTSAPPEDAERVGDIRKRERDERMRSRNRRYALSIAAVIVGSIALVFAGVFVYRSDLFAITTVNAEGATHLTSSEIAEIAAVPDDTTLLRVDIDSIVSRLESSAWVETASVTRVFPDTIAISIEECEAGAIVQLSEDSTWVISSDGTWLSPAIDVDIESLMLVADVDTSIDDPVSGAVCDDGGVQNALAVIAGLSDDLAARVSYISAESSIKTSLNLKNGVVVAFGDSSDISLKESVVLELLKEHRGKVTYINVRSPSRPTYRTM